MQGIITEKEKATFSIAAEPYIIQLIRSQFFFFKSASINPVYTERNTQGLEKLRGKKMEAMLQFPADR